MITDNDATIFFYSGTGNSFFVARILSDHIGNTKLISMIQAIGKYEIIASKTVGLVFPIHGKGIPPIVFDFIHNINFKNVEYLFAIVTYGGISGKALSMLRSAFMQKNVKLDYVRKIRMPANCVISYQVHLPSARRIDHINKKVQQLCDDIVVKKKSNFNFQYPRYTKEDLVEIMRNKKNKYANRGGLFYTDNSCVRCLKCVNICPVNNIHLNNNAIIFNDKCIQCMACINWCPKKSINWMGKTEKKNRYINPNVEFNELLVRYKDN